MYICIKFLHYKKEYQHLFDLFKDNIKNYILRDFQVEENLMANVKDKGVFKSHKLTQADLLQKSLTAILNYNSITSMTIHIG